MNEQNTPSNYNDTQNELIIKVREYMPNIKLIFRLHPNTGKLSVVIVNKRKNIISLEDIEWEDLKKQLDVIMTTIIKYSCFTCSLPIVKTRVSCSKCCTTLCSECYKDTCKYQNKYTSKNAFACPYCILPDTFDGYHYYI